VSSQTHIFMLVDTQAKVEKISTTKTSQEPDIVKPLPNF